MEDLSDLSLVDVFLCTRCPLPKEHRSIDVYINCPWRLHLDMADVWASAGRAARSAEIQADRAAEAPFGEPMPKA
jgi:hypothetical protein